MFDFRHDPTLDDFPKRHKLFTMVRRGVSFMEQTMEMQTYVNDIFSPEENIYECTDEVTLDK